MLLLVRGLKKLFSPCKNSFQSKHSSVDKCMVMRFGERVDDNCEKYQIFSESLQFVKVYKDLGVYVDVKLRLHEHVNLVVGPASSMISNLLRCCVSLY